MVNLETELSSTAANFVRPERSLQRSKETSRVVSAWVAFVVVVVVVRLDRDSTSSAFSVSSALSRPSRVPPPRKVRERELFGVVVVVVVKVFVADAAAVS